MAEQSQYYTHNKEVYDRLRPGDRVKFQGSAISSYWGIYVGRGMIVHLRGDREADPKLHANSSFLFRIGGKLFDRACISLDNFWMIAHNDRAYIDNSLDKTLQALDPKSIVQRATEKLGVVSYNQIYSNCEQFTNWCRYGEEKKSEQVSDAAIGVSVTAGILGVLGTVGGIMLYKAFSKKEDEKKEKK